ncbi:MAG: hypothetical protein K0B10_11915 [Vicingaceae bacterium]|nr:hypothetical protein [Vicingaceae bacterium]
MKTILIYILTAFPFVTFGQKSNTIFSTGANGLMQWTYQDFIDHNIERIQAFSFKLKKNGKVKKDSTKLFDQNLNRDSSIVMGINCNLNIQSHVPTFLTWYKFKDYYDSMGKLIKHTNQPIEVVKTKGFGSTNWDININETTFEYDGEGLLTRKVYNRIEHSYSVSKYTKDTFHLHSIHPKIYEYEYDEQGLEVRNYYTDDSTRYLATESYTPDTASVKCFYCDPRYLNGEKEYDSQGNLIKWIWYTRKNEIHSKKYYFYDENDNLIKQIDSTGWYLQQYSEDEPSLQSTKTFKYRNDQLLKTIEVKGDWTYISEYDEKGNLVSNCLQIADTKNGCTKYNYVYQNGLIKEIHTLPNQKTIFGYNNDGLLIEKKDYLNEKLTSLIRYYYP